MKRQWGRDDVGEGGLQGEPSGWMDLDKERPSGQRAMGGHRTASPPGCYAHTHTLKAIH